MRRILLSMALLAGLSGTAFAQTAPASEIAPGGKLRVGMIAITVLGGVAEPIAGFVGQKLGAAVEPVMYPNPEAYLQSFGKSEWDIAIGPRVLAPADKADSTANLWAISLVYPEPHSAVECRLLALFGHVTMSSEAEEVLFIRDLFRDG